MAISACAEEPCDVRESGDDQIPKTALISKLDLSQILLKVIKTPFNNSRVFFLLHCTAYIAHMHHHNAIAVAVPDRVSVAPFDL